MSLATRDEERIKAVVQMVKETPTIELLRSLLPPDCPETIVRDLEKKMTFLHGGLLVFPSSFFEIQQLLTTLGMTIVFLIPSVIVRRRLAQRYQLAEELLDIQIVESSWEREDGELAKLELFVLLHATPGLTETIRETERIQEYENHVAFVLHDPSSYLSLRACFNRYGFSDDGGGINPWDNARKTIRYLVHPMTKRRVELIMYSQESMLLGGDEYL